MKHYGDGSKRFVYNILSKNLYEKNILPHVVKKGSKQTNTQSKKNTTLCQATLLKRFRPKMTFCEIKKIYLRSTGLSRLYEKCHLKKHLLKRGVTSTVLLYIIPLCKMPYVKNDTSPKLQFPAVQVTFGELS
jgi:hypothetical protein